MHIIIAGCGKMATAIADECQAQNVPFSRWSKDYKLQSKPDETVLIHVGSGRELPDIIEYCTKLGAENAPTILHGSTGQDKLIPQNPGCPIVKTPNFALPMLAFIKNLPRIAWGLAPREQVKVARIMESHQSTKKSVPGTAVAMARVLGMPESMIESVRDPETQIALGVNPEALDGHGYHWIELEVNGVRFGFSTKIDGRVPYAKGALQIAEHIACNWNTLLNGVYTTNEQCEIVPA